MICPDCNNDMEEHEVSEWDENYICKRCKLLVSIARDIYMDPDGEDEDDF